LEKVIRDLGIQTRGTIFFKTVQILAYADDIDLMAHTTLGLNEAFLNLEKSARNMGLVINQEKTIYVYSGKDTTLHQDLAIGNYMFNPLTPNEPYIGRTAPLPLNLSFYIFIQQTYVLNILNVVYTLRFFLFKMQFVS